MAARWAMSSVMRRALAALAAQLPGATAGQCVSAPSSISAPHLSKAVIVLPSLLGWQPAYTAARIQPSIARHRALSTLSDSITMTPAIEAQLDRIRQRHADVLQQLNDIASLSPASMAKLNRELSELQPVVEATQQLAAKRHELADLAALVEDAGEDDEMRRMARDEHAALQGQLPGLERELLLLLLPKDVDDARGVVLEVRAGTGGDEACLFAWELFRMYERYAATQRWKFEVVELVESDLGGCKLASAAISGPGDIFGRLKFESGIHRVQRVPVTDSGGRVHTSAASVAVLAQADELEVAVRDEDLRIDTYRSGGAGGQHVNTTNSAVRVTHLPTGLVVAIQDERSQHKNKAKALKVLRARLYEAEQRRQRASQSRERKEQIGSGDRSERIRTYNFPQGRVTDHRVGMTEHGMDAVLSGERLPVFIEALQLHHQSRLLASLDAGGT